MSFASRMSFLGNRSRRYGELQLPVSGELVRFQSLSEREFAEYELDSLHQTDDGLRTDEDKLRQSRARLIVLCLVDEAGAKLLNDADMDAIDDLDAADTTILYDKLREHCGIARRVREASERQETLKKTSNGVLVGASPSS